MNLGHLEVPIVKNLKTQKILSLPYTLRISFRVMLNF